VYREVISFLRVAPDFEPDFAVHNPARSYTPNISLRSFMKSHPGLHRMIQVVVPEGAMESLRRAVALVQKQRPSRMDPELRRQLRRRFREEIGELENLIDRDLSGWVQDPEVAARCAD